MDKGDGGSKKRLVGHPLLPRYSSPSVCGHVLFLGAVLVSGQRSKQFPKSNEALHSSPVSEDSFT